ncbi:nucleotidyltransferase family protein [Cohnella sp. JJ-181]|uniref:nucleotidyltransferase family protein n=1 Tax=Cohnella rhizoplanae TaxID=2974897 RepID=UPI0022FF7FA4|nr:nucleotidyltransferase family protein [Cohnella sp. JJ-181]CAI6025527.1 Purine catabolism protein PucB [Cohnella sp. JJ-181]
MGRPKLSLAFADGETLGARAWRAFADARVLTHLIAVVRPEDPLDWLPEPGSAEIVRSPESARGMSYSLRAGLRAARGHSPDAVLVALADQPFLTPALYGEVTSAFTASPGVDYVACGYGSFSAPPAIFSPRLFDALAALEGDTGARKLFSDAKYTGIRIGVPDPDARMDVDTPADWEKATEKRCRMFGNGD